MRREQEGLARVEADALEDAVPIQEAVIEHRHPGLMRVGEPLAVDERYPCLGDYFLNDQ
jgi:hypothetical protein